MRNPAVRAYSCPCEILEIRRLMAGHIVAQVIDGDLVLAGDQYGNRIAVDQIDLPAGSVRVTPYATEINGSESPFKSEVFSGVTKGIKARLGLGDDRLTLQDLSLAGGLEVITGAGQDSILLSGVTLGGGIFARTKMDADSFHVYDSSIGGDVAIYTGRGADVVSFDGVTFGGQLRVGTLRGWDSIATGDSALPEAAVLDAGPGQNLVTSNGTISLDYDFADDEQGWEAGFADYSLVRHSGQSMLGLDAGLRVLPSELHEDGTGYMLSGANSSDDLFMYLKRRLGPEDGIVGGQAYQFSMRIRFASNTPADLAGPGLPALDVTMKAGVTAAEPQTIETADGYRMNVDKGAQDNEGPAGSIVGHIANGLELDDVWPELPYASVLGTHVGRTGATAESTGELWLLVGTDSGFEGVTTLYYQSIEVRLTPLTRAAAAAGQQVSSMM